MANIKTHNDIKKENLSSYGRFQLERYGNLLGSRMIITNEEDSPMPTTEENYIYELENPEL